jgi:hypothetical protein
MGHAGLLKRCLWEKRLPTPPPWRENRADSFSRPGRSTRLSGRLFPDIGDFAEVAVIEPLVKPGDSIKAEQRLISTEYQVDQCINW